MMIGTLPYTKKSHRLKALSGSVSFYTGNPYRIFSHMGIIASLIFNFNIFEIFINNSSGIIPLYLLGLPLMIIPSYLLFSKLAKKTVVKSISPKKKWILVGLLCATFVATMESEAAFFNIEVTHSALQYFGAKIPDSASQLIFFGIIFGALWIPFIE